MREKERVRYYYCFKVWELGNANAVFIEKQRREKYRQWKRELGIERWDLRTGEERQRVLTGFWEVIKKVISDYPFLKMAVARLSGFGSGPCSNGQGRAEKSKTWPESVGFRVGSDRLCLNLLFTKFGVSCRVFQKNEARPGPWPTTSCSCHAVLFSCLC